MIMPFTLLWWPNPAVEAAFARRFAAKYFESADLLFRTVRASVIPVFLCVRLWQHGLGKHGLHALCCVALAAVVEWLGFGWQRDRLGRKRTTMAIVTRIVLLFSQVVDAASLPIVVQTPLSMLRFLFMQTGLLPMLLSTIGVPLLVKHHLVVSFASVVAMRVFMVGNMCAVAVSAAESGPMVIISWRIVNAILTGGAFEDKALPAPYDACRSVVTMSHFVLGMLVPSYVMWTVEYENRMRFVEGRREALTDVTMGRQMLLFVPVMVIVWLLMNIRVWM
ncbi:unnamed protein product [Ostreobium quekettii]|uniref:Uncharacterized protein n=1 Tax=Ostreobium quekettii TaxID=121088 RepID=A0A8S1IKK2_9CHLO|nr:unnamed protein product [Ostreobium quekettii]|eukprot:evm.model.scf_7.27 EVM.evm.TU.scf_7.27   scf_7:215624-216457(+)